MNPLLSQSRRPKKKRGSQFMDLLYPAEAITFPAIDRIAPDVIKASFSGIHGVSLDSSVTLSCSLFFGRPIFGKKDKDSERIFSHVIDLRLSRLEVPLLGLQHGWDLCRRQKEIPFLRLSGICRIWFYSLCLYEPVVEVQATETQAAFKTGGGELRLVMVRKTSNDPWRMDLAPSCDYCPNEDCIALAQL